MSQTYHLGEPLPALPASPDAWDRLAVRRSVPAQDLAAPGPSPEQVRALIALAARSPDHGKLTPWRFVVIAAEDKPRLVERLRTLAADQPDPAKAEAVLAKLANPPVTILVVSSPVTSQKVPVWEQQLSAGAVCMNLEHAGAALGFASNWITDWYAFAPRALAVLGVGAEERVAGFIHLGTAPAAPIERVRPDADALTTRWRL